MRKLFFKLDDFPKDIVQQENPVTSTTNVFKFRNSNNQKITQVDKEQLRSSLTRYGFISPKSQKSKRRGLKLGQKLERQVDFKDAVKHVKGMQKDKKDVKRESIYSQLKLLQMSQETNSNFNPEISDIERSVGVEDKMFQSARPSINFRASGLSFQNVFSRKNQRQRGSNEGQFSQDSTGLKEQYQDQQTFSVATGPETRNKLSKIHHTAQESFLDAGNTLFTQSGDQEFTDYNQDQSNAQLISQKRGPINYQNIVHKNFKAKKPYIQSYYRKRKQTTSVAQCLQSNMKFGRINFSENKRSRDNSSLGQSNLFEIEKSHQMATNVQQSYQFREQDSIHEKNAEVKSSQGIQMKQFDNDNENRNSRPKTMQAFRPNMNEKINLNELNNGGILNIQIQDQESKQFQSTKISQHKLVSFDQKANFNFEKPNNFFQMRASQPVNVLKGAFSFSRGSQRNKISPLQDDMRMLRNSFQEKSTKNEDKEWSQTMAQIYEKKYKKEEMISGVQDQLEAIRSNKIGFVSQVAAGTDEAHYQYQTSNSSPTKNSLNGHWAAQVGNSQLKMVYKKQLDLGQVGTRVIGKKFEGQQKLFGYQSPKFSSNFNSSNFSISINEFEDGQESPLSKSKHRSKRKAQRSPRVMRKNQIFAQIRQGTVEMTDNEILDKIGKVAQESKKEKVRRETLEKLEREREKEEAAKIERERSQGTYLMDKDVGLMKKLLDEKIQENRDFLENLIQNDLQHRGLGNHVRSDEIEEFRKGNLEYCRQRVQITMFNRIMRERAQKVDDGKNQGKTKQSCAIQQRIDQFSKSLRSYKKNPLEIQPKKSVEKQLLIPPVEPCDHQTGRENIVLESYKQFKTWWIQRDKIRKTQPEDITQKQCIQNLKFQKGSQLNHQFDIATTQHERDQIMETMREVAEQMKRLDDKDGQIKAVDIFKKYGDVDPSDLEGPQEQYTQPVIPQESILMSKMCQDPNHPYNFESKEAENLVNQTASDQLLQHAAKQIIEINFGQEQDIDHWSKFVKMKEYEQPLKEDENPMTEPTEPDDPEEKRARKLASRKTSMELVSKAKQQEQQFNHTIEIMYNQYLGKSSIERDDEILLEENHTKKIMSPFSGTSTPMSPQSSLQSVDASLGKEIAVNKMFFEFIQNQSDKQKPFKTKEKGKKFSEGASDISKMFFDFYMESYYNQRTASVPPFTFNRNKTVMINSFKLSQGQVSGLSKILEKHNGPMSHMIDKIYLNNCTLGDEGFAMLLKGFKKLKQVSSITYANDVLLSLATKELVQLLNNPMDIEDKLGQTLLRTMSQTKFKDNPEMISKIKPKKGQVSSFNLLSVKTNNTCLIEIFKQLTDLQNIQQLRISDVCLNNFKVFQELVNTLSNTRGLTLIDLSDSSLSANQLKEIALTLKEGAAPKLKNLNLSYNPFHLNQISTAKNAPEGPKKGQQQDKKEKDARQKEKVLNDGAVEFLDEFCEFLATPYIKLAHLNLSGMNLQHRVLRLAPVLSKCNSLVSVHLEDNNLDEHTQSKVLESFGISSYFQSPQYRPNTRIQTELLSEKFRAVKKYLLQQDLESFVNTEPNCSASEVNKCLMMNCLHLKNLKRQCQINEQLSKEFRRGLEQSHAIVRQHPLLFTKHLQCDQVMRLHDAIQNGKEDIEHDQKWSADVNQSCVTCERFSSIQVYFTPKKADKEFTKVTDEHVISYLRHIYQLDETKFKVPIIFGSLIDKWQGTKPMLYTSHYSLGCIVNKGSGKDLADNRKQLIKYAQFASKNRDDPVAKYQTRQNVTEKDPFIDTKFYPSKVIRRKLLGRQIPGLSEQERLQKQSEHLKVHERILTYNQPFENKETERSMDSPLPVQQSQKKGKKRQMVKEDEPKIHMPEEFIFSGRVSPGIHLVLIFDPISKELFKKVITVMPRDEDKDNDDPPEPLDDLEFQLPSAINLIENSKQREELSQQAFEYDVSDSNFKPFEAVQNPDILNNYMRFFYQNYDFLIQGQKSLLLKQFEGSQKYQDSIQNGIRQNPDKNFIALFENIMCQRVRKDTILNILAQKIDPGLAPIIEEAFAEKQQDDLSSRMELTEFLIRIDQKHQQLSNEKEDPKPLLVRIFEVFKDFSLVHSEVFQLMLKNKFLHGVIHQNLNTLKRVFDKFTTLEPESNQMTPSFTLDSACSMIFQTLNNIPKKSREKIGVPLEMISRLFFSSKFCIVNEEIFSNQNKFLTFQEFVLFVAMMTNEQLLLDPLNKEEKEKFIEQNQKLIEQYCMHATGEKIVFVLSRVLGLGESDQKLGLDLGQLEHFQAQTVEEFKIKGKGIKFN